MSPPAAFVISHKHDQYHFTYESTVGIKSYYSFLYLGDILCISSSAPPSSIRLTLTSYKESEDADIGEQVEWSTSMSLALYLARWPIRLIWALCWDDVSKTDEEWPDQSSLSVGKGEAVRLF